MDSKEDFTQLRLHFTDPVQHDYEVIRPVVQFAQSANSRGRETAVPRTTVREKAKQFVIEGMLGLVDQRATAAGSREIGFPDPVAKYILYLKHLYPPIHYRDSGAPVTPEYSPPFEFTGTIDSVTVDVSGELIRDTEAEMRQIMARQ